MAAYTFLVTVELRRESGKFAGRDEILDGLREQLEQAAGEGLSGLGADGATEYVVDDVAVDEYTPPRASRRLRPAPAEGGAS